MIKKLSDFVVNRRYWILCVMLLTAAASIFMMQQVEINKDMTKYLPDGSAMKEGMDVMEKEFPEMETLQTIRVMFDDLQEGQKDGVLQKLEEIPYVDSVTYESGSKDYNKDNHTLYILNTEYDYNSSEELAVENALDKEFTGYSLIWQNDDTDQSGVPAWILAAALGILLVILFAMCGSWIEPILFIAVIGIAIVINMGTNIIMGNVSDVTFSIAAILQLVLSMDYSIILINRYRQEKEKIDDKNLAMKEALAHAFSSVASSSLTTVVGLLMLVFMSFKIGLDLGVVLAKGVFISMVCVLTMMPGIILACDKLIQKTAKKELYIPMNWAARFSYKWRHGLGVLFLLLFAGVYWMQSQAGISYTLQNEDAIEDVFPTDNMMVMVYENQDEAAVSELAERLEKDENIKSVMSYSTMLAKPYTSKELAAEITDMGDDFALDSSVIDLLYYNYFEDGRTEPMEASDFLDFVSGTVMENETFSEHIDADMKDKTELIKKFASPDELVQPMNAEKLANFFDIDKEDIENLLLYYYVEKGGVPTGKMTLATFADFVVNEVAKDKTYGSMFDDDTRKKMEQFAVFTDAAAMKKDSDYKKIASLLDMDSDTVKLLFVYYYALSDDYLPEGMTLPAFVNYIQKDIASNPVFQSSFDKETLKQIDMLAVFTDKNKIKKQRSPKKLAELLDMDTEMVQQIFMMYYGSKNVNKGISFTAFTDFLVNNVMKNPAYSSSFDKNTKAQIQQMNQMASVAASGQILNSAQLADIVGMEESMVQSLFVYKAQGGTPVAGMTLQDFLAFMVDDVSTSPAFASQFDDTMKEQLKVLRQLVDLAASGKTLSYQQMAKNLGMGETQLKQLYILYWGKDISDRKLSVKQTIHFLLSDSAMYSSLDANARKQLKFLQKIMAAAESGKTYSYTKMGSLLGMDNSMVKMIYTYHESDSAAGKWRLSMHTIINFLVKNTDQLGSMMKKEDIAQLKTAQKLINGSVNGISYSAKSLAGLMGMDMKQAEQLYLLYISRHGDISGWTLSVKEFIGFINSNVLENPDFSDQFDSDTAAMLAEADTLVKAVVSGGTYTAAQMSEIFEGFSGELDEDTMELMYLYAASEKDSDATWKMSMETLFYYLTDDILKDSRFTNLIDDEMRKDLQEAQEELEDGKKQLVTKQYSRMIITSSYPEESVQTTAFIKDLNAEGDEKFTGDFFLIGNSAMTYEMQQTFHKELLFITMLTAAAIFLIVALTFRSVFIPLILVLVVQCGVYATISVVALQGGSMYYLALLIVECILMGATIDYGILFTNYYCENRKSMSVKEALEAAYAGSIHTILTSGLILILVTAIVGNFFSEPTTAAIVRTISIGALCATILILFILPGLLVCCDRLVIRKRADKK